MKLGISDWRFRSGHWLESIDQMTISGLMLALCLWLIAVGNIDQSIQQLFFDAQTHEWLIDRNNGFLRSIFYHGIKYAVIAFSVLLVGLLIVGFCTKARTLDYRAVCFVIACLIAVPSFIAWLKYLTGIACPYQMEAYGGSLPDHHFWNIHWPDGIKHPRCFPASHPAGGFALLALAYVSPHKKKMLTIALVAGCLMSFYQIARGAHYLSHCIATLFLSIIVINIIHIIFLSFLSVWKTIRQHKAVHRIGAA